MRHMTKIICNQRLDENQPEPVSGRTPNISYRKRCPLRYFSLFWKGRHEFAKILAFSTPLTTCVKEKDQQICQGKREIPVTLHMGKR